MTNVPTRCSKKVKILGKATPRRPRATQAPLKPTKPAAVPRAVVCCAAATSLGAVFMGCQDVSFTKSKAYIFKHPQSAVVHGAHEHLNSKTM